MSGVDGVSPATLPCNFAQEKYDTLFGEVVSAAAHGYLSKAAGSLMMISSIRCIIWCWRLLPVVSELRQAKESCSNQVV